MDTLLTTVSLRLLWDWWILNDVEIALPNAHFRYRGSIEYRDTRDGIVIAVAISGIAQHYFVPNISEVEQSAAELLII